MKRTMIIGLFCIACVMAAGALSGARAQSEFKDVPYFSGMSNHAIVDATDQEFADYNFFNGDSCTTVEGRKYFRAYTHKEGAPLSSDLQIARNYANAVKAMGGTVLFDGICSGAECAENCGDRMMVGKVLKDGSELWVEVVPFNDGNDYYLTAVVKEAMKQDVTASGLFEALNRDGRVSLYINFDTGKATIKSESQPIVDRIVEMMKANPALKARVEGHTDNVGSPESNKALSDKRAAAVVAAIVAKGVDAKRLNAAGFGQEKPVADNKTEEGRAKNRRVELVKE